MLLFGCGALGHRHHVEGGQQAEQTDEDSRACCWLSVVTLEEVVEQRLPTITEAASATEWCWSMERYRRQFLSSDFPILLSWTKNSITWTLYQLLTRSCWSLWHQCTELHYADSGVFFLKSSHNNRRFLKLSVHTDLKVSWAATSCISTLHRCPFVF